MTTFLYVSAHKEKRSDSTGYQRLQQRRRQKQEIPTTVSPDIAEPMKIDNRRVKAFKILRGTLPLTLAPHASRILVIRSAHTNLKLNL